MKYHPLLTTSALVLSLATASVPLSVAYAQAPAASVYAKPGQPNKQAILAQLPPAKAKLYRDAMKLTYDKNKPIYEQVKQAQTAQDAILTAPTFDKAAYIAKTKEIEALYSQMRANNTEAFATVAAVFTPAERNILAELHQKPAPAATPAAAPQPAAR